MVLKSVFLCSKAGRYVSGTAQLITKLRANADKMRTNGVEFEEYDGLRYSWLDTVNLVWRLDLPYAELDVLDIVDAEGID